MSMQTNIIYGMGFEVYASDEQLKNFFIAHRNTIEEMDRLEVCNTQFVLDYIDETADDEFNPKEDLSGSEFLFGACGIYGLVSSIMFYETKVRFECYQDQDDENDYILLPRVMPWMYNETERALTRESLAEICNKYIKELNPTLEYTDIKVEYFG